MFAFFGRLTAQLKSFESIWEALKKLVNLKVAKLLPSISFPPKATATYCMIDFLRAWKKYGKAVLANKPQEYPFIYWSDIELPLSDLHKNRQRRENMKYLRQRKSIVSRNQFRPCQSGSYVKKAKMIIKFFRKEAKMFNDWKLLRQTDEIPKPIIKATQILRKQNE